MIYLILIFGWEFSTGFVLNLFNACPWDYSWFPFNIMGLITLEYAPLWFIGSILAEQVLIPFINKLKWETNNIMNEKTQYNKVNLN